MQMHEEIKTYQTLNKWIEQDPNYVDTLARRNWLYTKPGEEVIWYTDGGQL